MKYFLDTNICIFLINAKFPRLNDFYLTRRPEEIFIPSVVLFELTYGAMKSQRREQNLRKIGVFLSDVETIPFDDNAAAIAGRIRADLERCGASIGGNDVLIAATALAGGGLLVTNNTREFERVKELVIEDWTQENSAPR
jgi:tRNA(fMet)-specific endonuclease VapC